MSINDTDIEKANLLQKATSSAILTDKSLLLTGEMPNFNVNILMDVVEAIKARHKIQAPTITIQRPPTPADNEP